ncbi:MAG: hypothetical protein IKK53_04630 [Ruminiclostridium sp.]|nr:hypothetical protein [Ruminiclostridium sp.]
MTNPVNISKMFAPVLNSSQKNEKPKTEEELELLEAQKKQQEEAQKKAQEEARKKQMENEKAMLDMQLESAREQSEAIEDSFSTFSKCMTIAHRITKGDKVPLKDMKYLMENEPDLYKQAILMRQPNPKPKEHKSVLEEDDEQVSTEEYSQGGGEAPPASEMPAVQALSESTPVSGEAPTGE